MKNSYKTIFGRALDKQLSARRISQTKLAKLIGTTPQYLNRLTSSSNNVSPQWADSISRALNLDPKATQEIHLAAAMTSGYKLPEPVIKDFDLFKKPNP